MVWNAGLMQLMLLSGITRQHLMIQTQPEVRTCSTKAGHNNSLESVVRPKLPELKETRLGLHTTHCMKMS